MGVTMEGTAVAAAPLADLKAYLRITLDDEDAGLGRLLLTATDLAERFTGQILVDRGADEVLPVTGAWQRLLARPVREVVAVTGVPAEGAAFALPTDAYAIDIDRNGDGWIRVARPGAAGRVRVRYRAGIAGDADGVPDAIRHGIVRLAAEYHAASPGERERGVQPPAAVAALWRPWRRMRLA